MRVVSSSSLGSDAMRRALIGLTILMGLFAAAVGAYMRWYFPRDPRRDVDPRARVVSPADGRIVYVARVEDGTVPIAIKNRRMLPLDEIVKGEDRPPAGALIGIFMSPFDVHYQRSPIAGVVGEVTYQPAAFNHVMGSMFLRSLVGVQPFHEKSPHIYANERNVIRIDGNELTAFVVQIADQQVNKIDCSVGIGDSLAAGDRIGMIRRGSQVDLFLPGLSPEDFPDLRVGIKVRAGSTTLL